MRLSAVGWVQTADWVQTANRGLFCVDRTTWKGYGWLPRATNGAARGASTPRRRQPCLTWPAALCRSAVLGPCCAYAHASYVSLEM